MGTHRRWALVVAGAVVLAACGGDDGGGDAGTATSASPSTTGARPAAESRFTGHDEFCRPAEGDPEEVPTATDDGITADEIVVTHVRTMTEQLVGLGFAVDIGDPKDQAATFVDIVNERCGGIHGRRLRFDTVDIAIPGLSSDADAEAQAVCIAVAEDRQAVVAYSYSGAGGVLIPCLTGRHDVAYVTNYSVTQSDLDQADGRLFAVSHDPAKLLRYAVQVLRDELEGKRVGVVHQDTVGDPEIVERGLVAALREADVDVIRVDPIGCNNTSRCTDNVIASVQGMMADEVEVIFPLLNVVNLPTYLGEMVTQGAEPGRFRFYNTGYLVQETEIAAGKIVEFAGPEAGALYDGTTVIAAARTGRHRLPDFEPDPFGTMCNEEYAAHSSAVDVAYRPGDEDGGKYGGTAGQCAVIRIIARAIEAAGPNPSRADVARAIASLGEVDLVDGVPGSFAPGKPTAPDVLARMTFRYPCPLETANPVGHCFVPEEDFVALPES
jgi:hypothetical protein